MGRIGTDMHAVGKSDQLSMATLSLSGPLIVKQATRRSFTTVAKQENRIQGC